MKNGLCIKWIQNYQVPTQEEYSALLEKNVAPQVQTLWRGDEAEVPFAILTGEQLMEDVRISVSDFTSSDSVLSATTIEAIFIKETKAFMGNCTKADQSRKSFPDVLFGGTSVDIPARHVQNVWVKIPVPASTKPGRYNGFVSVSCPSIEEAITLEITLEVLDLLLPPAKDFSFDIELWQYPYRVAQYYGLEPFGAEHLAVLKNHLSHYAKAGGHAITASIVEEPWNAQTYGQFPSMVKWRRDKNKHFTFDFTQFDSWVTLCKEMGMGDKIVCYSIIPWGNKIAFYDEKKEKMKTIAPVTGTHKYKKVWTEFLRALITHVEEKGWFDDTYVGIDERKFMDKAFTLIESVKGKNGKPLKKSVAMDHFTQKFFPLIDRIDSISIGSLTVKKAIPDFERLIEHRSHNPKLKTTIYTCVGHFPNSFTYSMPMEGYWTMLFCGSLGTTGYLRWALDAWVKDPLRDTSHTAFESGDCFLLYPDEADSPARETKSSVRYEMLLKGLRDTNKLSILANDSPQWKHRVDALLQGIKPTYSQDHDGIADAKSRAELPQDMANFITEMNTLFRAFAQ